MSTFSKFNDNFLVFLILVFPIVFLFRSVAINFISLLIIIVYLSNISSKQISIAKKYNLFLLIFFIIILILSTYLAFGFSANFYKSIVLIKIPILLIAIIQTFSNLNNYQFSKKFILFLSIFFSIFMVDILIQFFLGKNIFGFKAGMCNIYEECGRFGGMFDDELISGAYISLIIIPFFLLLNKVFKNSYIRILPIIFLLVVIITGERTATVLSFLFCLIYYILLNSKKEKFFYFIIFLLTLISIASVLPEKSLKRYSSEIIKMLQIDNHGKKEINFTKNNPWFKHYIVGINIFKEKPLLGNGLKSFRVKCSKYDKLLFNESKQKACTTHPHNFFIEVLADTGILGFLSFISFFILLIFLNRDKLKSPDDRLILIYLIIIIFLPRPTGSIFSTYFLNMFIYSIGALTGIMNLNIRLYRNEEKL